MKKLIWGLIVLAAIVGGFYWFNSYIYEQKQAYAASDYKDAEYIIGGERVRLVDGVGETETETAMGNASKTTVHYFGNEVWTDLNGDGKEDIVFLLTQETGGSGTFFYAAAALNTARGYVGSEAVYLGDRIAPQSTNVDDKGLVVVNYADRAPGEPMSASPSVGKSIWLKFDPVAMNFGEVAQNFEGESETNAGIRGVVMLGPTCPVMKDPPEPQCADKPYETMVAIFKADDPVHAIALFKSNTDGTFKINLPPGEYVVGAGESNLPRCVQTSATVQADMFTDIVVSCDSGIR